MGFRFRKSVKIAPGVKVNFGKKGASVTVGNKYARTTVGKGRRTNSVSIPGTGVSYVKQTSTNKKVNTVSNQSNFSAPSGGNGNKGPNQQMSWETAMKIIKWSFYAFLGFILLMMLSDSPAVLIGVAVIVTGMVLTKKKKQGKIKSNKTWMVSTFGWLLTLVLWMANMEPVENNTLTPEPSNEINSVVSIPEEPEKEDAAEVETQPATAPTESDKPEETPIVEEPAEDEVNEEPVSQPVVESEYFSNCKEMNAVYPNGVPEDHPAYDSARDRDKDGWACER